MKSKINRAALCAGALVFSAFTYATADAAEIYSTHVNEGVVTVKGANFQGRVCAEVDGAEATATREGSGSVTVDISTLSLAPGVYTLEIGRFNRNDQCRRKDEASIAIGAIGADGVDGAQGLAGADGVDGAQGLAGADGNDGAQGLAGNDGADGAQGLAGVDGVGPGWC